MWRNGRNKIFYFLMFGVLCSNCSVASNTDNVIRNKDKNIPSKYNVIPELNEYKEGARDCLKKTLEIIFPENKKATNILEIMSSIENGKKINLNFEEKEIKIAQTMLLAETTFLYCSINTVLQKHKDDNLFGEVTVNSFSTAIIGGVNYDHSCYLRFIIDNLVFHANIIEIGKQQQKITKLQHDTENKEFIVQAIKKESWIDDSLDSWPCKGSEDFKELLRKYLKKVLDLIILNKTEKDRIIDRMDKIHKDDNDNSLQLNAIQRNEEELVSRITLHENEILDVFNKWNNLQGLEDLAYSMSYDIMKNAVVDRINELEKQENNQLQDQDSKQEIDRNYLEFLIKNYIKDCLFWIIKSEEKLYKKLDKYLTKDTIICLASKKQMGEICKKLLENKIFIKNYLKDKKTCFLCIPIGDKNHGWKKLGVIFGYCCTLGLVISGIYFIVSNFFVKKNESDYHEPSYENNESGQILGIDD